MRAVGGSRYGPPMSAEPSDLAAAGDHVGVIGAAAKGEGEEGDLDPPRPTTQPYLLGAGLLILVCRELTETGEKIGNVVIDVAS
jgi:hypothetical protein